ncbi:MAG: sulfurtransferase [Thermoleophilia bacterium]
MGAKSRVSTDQLGVLIAQPDVRIVDVRIVLDDMRAGHRSYLEAHIPGAVYLHWIDDLSDPNDPVSGNLAPPDRFEEAMERAGIGPQTRVVAYDDNELFMAARLAWCLRAYGHEAVSVLDGGLPKWRREGRPVESGPVQPVRAPRFVASPQPGLRVGRQQVIDLLDDDDVVLLDCRMDTTWESAGEHIPGARRLPAPSLVRGVGGTLLPVEEIAALAEQAGAERDSNIVLYCGGGISASLAFEALQAAGYGKVSVYDGSWSDWASDESLPREMHGEQKTSV